MATARCRAMAQRPDGIERRLSASASSHQFGGDAAIVAPADDAARFIQFNLLRIAHSRFVNPVMPRTISPCAILFDRSRGQCIGVDDGDAPGPALVPALTYMADYQCAEDQKPGCIDLAKAA